MYNFDMSKGVIIGIVVVALVGVGGFFLYQSANTGDTASVSITGEDGEVEVNGSFADLLNSGKSYTCTFETLDKSGTGSTGTVYVTADGDKMNGDFTYTQADGASFDGGVIRDGEYNYVWTSMQEQGIKTKIDPENDTIFGTTGAEDETDTNAGLSDGQEVGFNCKVWAEDDSMFVPPSDIEFLEVSVDLVELDEEVMEVDKLDCSVCDQVPAGATKDQCLMTLGC